MESLPADEIVLNFDFQKQLFKKSNSSYRAHLGDSCDSISKKIQIHTRLLVLHFG